MMTQEKLTRLYLRQVRPIGLGIRLVLPKEAFMEVVGTIDPAFVRGPEGDPKEFDWCSGIVTYWDDD